MKECLTCRMYNTIWQTIPLTQPNHNKDGESCDNVRHYISYWKQGRPPSAYPQCRKPATTIRSIQFHPIQFNITDDASTEHTSDDDTMKYGKSKGDKTKSGTPKSAMKNAISKGGDDTNDREEVVGTSGTWGYYILGSGIRMLDFYYNTVFGAGQLLLIPPTSETIYFLVSTTYYCGYLQNFEILKFE